MERDYWKLREIETRYRLVFDASNEAVMIVSASNLRIIEANRTAVEALNSSRRRNEDLSGRELLHDVAAEDRDAVREVLDINAGKLGLGEFETRTILDAYAIPNVPGELAADAPQAAMIAKEIGFPVALKIVAEGVLHKSDAGGILLNLEDEESVRSGFELLTNRIRSQYPGAAIAGVMVEKMAPKGLEVIIGMRRDPTFGPMMIFGMGGTLVEQLKDISFRVGSK